MRKIAANYIFPISSEPIKNGVLVLDNSNIIVEIIDNKGELKEAEKTEFYNGILVPGFVVAFMGNEDIYLNKQTNEISQSIPVTANSNVIPFSFRTGDNIQSSNCIGINDDCGSILENMNQFLKKNHDISFQFILELLTLKGAETLGVFSNFGSFEKGKTPGVLLIERFNFQNMNISDKSTIKRLV
jgi:cytosine/adenosine deaminase-related metal-dependent hydrolase